MDHDYAIGRLQSDQHLGEPIRLNMRRDVICVAGIVLPSAQRHQNHLPTADTNIRMNVETSLFAKAAQPLRQGSFAFALGTDEDAPSLRDCSAPCHPLAEGGQPAHNAASVLLFEIAATPQTDNIARTVGAGSTVWVFLDNKHFLFLRPSNMDRLWSEQTNCALSGWSPFAETSRESPPKAPCEILSQARPLSPNGPYREQS